VLFRSAESRELELHGEKIIIIIPSVRLPSNEKTN